MTKVGCFPVLLVGGGSTMGYKLAGFDVIGCNEIDKRVMGLYERNHHPKYAYLMPIQDFKKKDNLPDELYNLDVLDGSPPCSTFSMVGSREDAWGKMRKFREGQAEQVLDTLFFDFIDLAERLKPKVVIAENVKGLLLGNAIDYVRRIYDAFDRAGYYCQHRLLDAATMGVPQHRERVFFLCLRKDLAAPFLERYSLFEERPKLDMCFNEQPLTCRAIGMKLDKEIKAPSNRGDWERLKRGEKQLHFNNILFGLDDVFPTLLSRYGQQSCAMPDWDLRYPDHESICKVSTFPLDYDFGSQRVEYVCGMCVPPVMMAQIASRIYEQWLSKIKNKQ